MLKVIVTGPAFVAIYLDGKMFKVGSYKCVGPSCDTTIDDDDEQLEFTVNSFLTHFLVLRNVPLLFSI